MSHVTVGAVTHTHTHTHTQANLINDKEINIYAIFMCFFMWKKHINMAYFLLNRKKSKIFLFNKNAI